MTTYTATLNASDLANVQSLCNSAVSYLHTLETSSGVSASVMTTITNLHNTLSQLAVLADDGFGQAPGFFSGGTSKHQ
jgi:site-specific recombinase